MNIIMRPPSEAFARAISTHPRHAELDPGKALRQHEALRAAMIEAGAQIVLLEPDLVNPDAPFVQDVAVTFPAPGDPGGRSVLLVATRPGAPTRRPEVSSVLAAAQTLRARRLPPADHRRAGHAGRRRRAALRRPRGRSASRAAPTGPAPSSSRRRCASWATGSSCAR